jgi:RimJ/RimL family protein N-acetyltransferase
MLQPVSIATAQRIWAARLGAPASGGTVASNEADSVQAVRLGDRDFVRIPAALASVSAHVSAAAWFDPRLIEGIPVAVRAHARLAYADRGSLRTNADAAVIPLGHNDARVRELARTMLDAEWDEAGLWRGANLAGWYGIEIEHRLVAIAAYENWDGLLAHLCVATDPVHRGQGHAILAAGVAATDALSKGLVAQWRSSVTNPASAAVGARLGFVDIGEQFVYGSLADA